MKWKSFVMIIFVILCLDLQVYAGSKEEFNEAKQQFSLIRADCAAKILFSMVYERFLKDVEFLASEAGMFTKTIINSDGVKISEKIYSSVDLRDVAYYTCLREYEIVKFRSFEERATRKISKDDDFEAGLYGLFKDCKQDSWLKNKHFYENMPNEYDSSKNVLRIAGPLFANTDCAVCHSNKYYEDGNLVGAMIVKIALKDPFQK